MKNIARLFLFISILLIFSCKKSLQTNNDPETEIHNSKILLPVKFESDQLIINLEYLKNTASLIKISGSDGYKITITYKDQQPYQIRKSKNDIPFQLVDYIKDKNNLLKARSFDENDAIYTPTGTYTLEYNDLSQLIKVRKYSNNGTLSGETSMSYSSSGNIISTAQYPGMNTTLNYAYDLKYGIFKYVESAECLFLESRYTFFTPGQNNILNRSNPVSESENLICSYEYNSDNYPAQISINYNNSIQVFKITYAELKP